jgi:O-antigen/teichoic acid export membrane protein
LSIQQSDHTINIVMIILSKLRSHPLLFSCVVASLDQSMLSMLNFFISIILIRNVPKVEYGYYAIAVPLSLFFVSIQNALVNAPLAVLLAAKKDHEKQRYVESLCYGQGVAVLPIVCILLLGIMLLRVWGLDSTRAYIAAAVCLASVGLLYLEFMRAYFFAQLSTARVLKMDSLHVAIVFGLVCLLLYSFTISVAAIFCLLGLSGLLTAFLFSRGFGWRYHGDAVKRSFLENWQYGKWALVGVTVTHIQSYFYLYLLGALVGSGAVAEVSASRLLLMPVALLQTGWYKIAIPHGSVLREQGRTHRYFKELLVANFVFLFGVLTYVALIFMFWNVLEQYVLTDKYANSLSYIPLWGVIFAIGCMTTNASLGLQVLKSFDTIAKFNLFTMVITAGCAYALIRDYGAKGGLAAQIVGEILLGAGLWYYFGRAAFSRHQTVDRS